MLHSVLRSCAGACLLFVGRNPRSSIATRTKPRRFAEKWRFSGATDDCLEAAGDLPYRRRPRLDGSFGQGCMGVDLGAKSGPPASPGWQHSGAEYPRSEALLRTGRRVWQPVDTRLRYARACPRRLEDWPNPGHDPHRAGRLGRVHRYRRRVGMAGDEREGDAVPGSTPRLTL